MPTFAGHLATWFGLSDNNRNSVTPRHLKRPCDRHRRLRGHHHHSCCGPPQRERERPGEPLYGLPLDAQTRDREAVHGAASVLEACGSESRASVDGWSGPQVRLRQPARRQHRAGSRSRPPPPIPSVPSCWTTPGPPSPVAGSGVIDARSLITPPPGVIYPTIRDGSTRLTPVTPFSVVVSHQDQRPGKHDRTRPSQRPPR